MHVTRKESVPHEKQPEVGLAVLAEQVVTSNTGKRITTPKAVAAPVYASAATLKVPFDSSKPADEEKKVENHAVKKTADSKSEGKTTERKLSSERRSEGRKSRFDSLENLSKQTKVKPGSSSGTLAESDAKLQKLAEQDKKDADLVPDFDHTTHPTGLFDLPLPEGRVPRKPKTAIV